MEPVQKTKGRLTWLWAVCLAAVTVTAVVHAPLYAQGENAADTESAPPPEKENFLWYVVTASPTFFVIMLGISIFLISLAVSSYQKLQLPKVLPKDLIAQLDTLLNEKNYKEAYEVLRGSDSLFSRALTSGVERLSHGFDRGVEAMVSVAEDGKLDMEHKVSPIATIGSVAPMLGLMGTVIGMILAFQEISLGGQPKPAELAENIGLALVTTLEGIVVAVPAIAMFAFFRNKIARLVFEVESVGEAYLWRFAGALKK